MRKRAVALSSQCVMLHCHLVGWFNASWRKYVYVYTCKFILAEGGKFMTEWERKISA